MHVYEYTLGRMGHMQVRTVQYTSEIVVMFNPSCSCFKGTVSRDFPAQTAYIIHLQITSLFLDKKDFASFCKLAEIFAFLIHS